MRYAVLFALLAVGLAAIAVMHGGWTWALGWPALSFAIVAAAYGGVGPSLLGKTRDGRRIVNLILLLPYLALARLAWWVTTKLRPGPPWHKLNDDIYIGRRTHTPPEGMQQIVDLTTEFVDPPWERKLVFPVLDGTAPSVEKLRQWVDEVLAGPMPVYVHCALGQGRAAMFTAALLLRSGKCTTLKDAVAMIKTVRPEIYLQRSQRAVLRALLEQPPADDASAHLSECQTERHVGK